MTKKATRKAKTTPITNRQHIIARQTLSHLAGIQSHMNTRQGIGYVVNGKKYIYNGDSRQEAGRGDLFYLNTGSHYTEDLPDNNKPYEQIVFYFTPEQIGRILSHLSLDHGLKIANDHSCRNCHEKNQLVYPGWNAVRSFFASVGQYAKDHLFSHDEIGDVAEQLKLTELVYLIVTKPDCCLKSKLLHNSDMMSENFEQIIYRNIFSDKTIDELAHECNKSLTSFKKDFNKHFFEPPHRWFIRQRLMKSRLLLISTNRPIAEIGSECRFPNTSHFIKLFKREYGMTPASYRTKHSESRVPERETVETTH